MYMNLSVENVKALCILQFRVSDSNFLSSIYSNYKVQIVNFHCNIKYKNWNNVYYTGKCSCVISLTPQIITRAVFQVQGTWVIFEKIRRRYYCITLVSEAALDEDFGYNRQRCMGTYVSVLGCLVSKLYWRIKGQASFKNTKRRKIIKFLGYE